MRSRSRRLRPPTESRESPPRAPPTRSWEWLLRADASAQLLFCENETNNERLFGVPNASPYVKDGVNEFVVHGAADAVNPARTGTKVAAHHVLAIAGGESGPLGVLSG